MRLVIAVALACVLAAPAGAAPHFELGIGEQQPAFFSDPRFVALGLEHVRVVTSYDVACRAVPETGYLDAWLAGALGAGARPLVAFSYSTRPGQRWKLPSYRTYLR